MHSVMHMVMKFTFCMYSALEIYNLCLGALYNQENCYFSLVSCSLADTMIKWWHIVMVTAAILTALGIVMTAVSYGSKWKSYVSHVILP